MLGQAAQGVDTGDIIVAIILASATIISAILGFLAVIHRRVRSVDDAVNHRHPNDPKLYDVVMTTANGLKEATAELAVNNQVTVEHGRVIKEEIVPELRRNGKDHEVLFDHLGIDREKLEVVAHPPGDETDSST